MGDREREKDKIWQGTDGGSLWIDYVLLPRKLEDHLALLANGTVSSPSPTALIVMFLDQAIASHKAISGASNAGKDDKTTVSKEEECTAVFFSLVGKTAAVLCEKAAKVAISRQFTLTDIEAIPSQQHQFLLLKSLVKHDKDSLLVRQCDLHRWIVRNLFQSHRIGLVASNAVAAFPNTSLCVLDDDSCSGNNSANGKTDMLTLASDIPCAGVNLEEGNTSVAFLENVLFQEEERACIGTVSNHCTRVDSERERDDSSREIFHNRSLSKWYKCQVMLDVAEAHFMRGQIKKAHDMFTICGHLLAELVVAEKSSNGIASSTFSVEPIPTLSKDAPVQRERLAGFIIACRVVLGMDSLMGLGRLEHVKEIDLYGPPLAELNCLSSAEWTVITCEQGRWMLRAMASYGAIAEAVSKDFLRGISLQSTDMGLPHRLNQLVQQTGAKDFQGVVRQTACAFAKQGTPNLFKNDIPVQKMKKTGSTFLHSLNPLEGHPLKFLSGGSNIVFPETILQESLFQTCVDDLMEGDLMWDYRLSLEKDHYIPVSIRLYLMACNSVSEVLAGSPLESFLRISDCFEDSKDAVYLLMGLIAAVQKRLGNLDERQQGIYFHENQQLSGLESARNRKRKSFSIKNYNVRELTSRLYKFVKYVCCVLDKPWCWSAALDSSLLTEGQVHSLGGSASIFHPDSSVEVQSPEAHLSQDSSIVDSMPKPSETTMLSSPKFKFSSQKDVEVIFQLMQAQTLPDFEALFGECKYFQSVHLHQDVSGLNLKGEDEDTKKLDYIHILQTCNCGDNKVAASLNEFQQGKLLCSCRKFLVTTASILRQKAFDAINSSKQYRLATCLFKLARDMDPKEGECSLMLWLLGKLDQNQRQHCDTNVIKLPEKWKMEIFPSLGLLEYMLQKLIENDFWNEVSELCNWVVSLFEEQCGRGDDDLEHKNDGQRGMGDASELPDTGADATHLSVSLSGVSELKQMLKVANSLCKLMMLCIPLLKTGICSDEVAHLWQNLWQLFEDFLLILLDADAPIQKDNLASQSHGSQVAEVPSSLYQSVREVTLVRRLSNPNVLMCLVSLAMGWLQRHHLARLTPWPFDVERYGALAGIMAGCVLPSSLCPITVSVHKNVSLIIPPGFCRELVYMFLERIVSLPGVVEGDRENGHIWLQGLADLAFDDGDHIKALRYYLQAGAIRSSYYCNRGSSMPPNIFTPWIIGRMISACRAIGAGLQGAVLCQCLPSPDYDLAFNILQESLVIMEQDMVLYSECVWEVPILELLMNMHSKAGDEFRVNTLIGLLQKPSLNLHNPLSIQQEYVEGLKQRFLQRFYDEICSTILQHYS